MLLSFFGQDWWNYWLTGLKEKKRSWLMHSVSNANKGKKGQMSLIKFRKLFPLGWCQFRLFSLLFTSILFFYFLTKRLQTEARSLFPHILLTLLMSFLISAGFSRLLRWKCSRMLHCLFSELNLFLTQNNNPTLFSLPALAFYCFQVWRPVFLASWCERSDWGSGR